MEATTPNNERMKLRGERKIPERVGRFSNKIVVALPGSHTRELYQEWSLAERSTLAQLRTDMARVNGYLHRIKAVPSKQCACMREKRWSIFFYYARNGMNSEKSYEYARLRGGMICPSDMEES